MAATIVFILYVVSTGNLPDFTALASFASKDACIAAATKVSEALSGADYPKTALCLSSDSLNELAQKNEISKQ